MTDHEQRQLAEAYQAAALALAALRAALAAAGVSVDGDTTAAEREARRRQADRERAKRRRDRQRHVTGPRTVDPGPAASADSSADYPAASRDASADFAPPSADSSADSGPAEGRARARVPYRKNLSSPQCLFAPLTNIPPHSADALATDPDALAILAALEDPPAAHDHPAEDGGHDHPAAPMAQERPALPPGRANATPDGSVEGPAVSGAPAAKRVRRSKAAPDQGTDVARVWEAYQAAVRPLGLRPRWTDSRRDLVARRLQDWSADELDRAIRGYVRSDWHRGQNDRGQVYLDLELIFRDARHIEAGHRYLDATPAPAKRGPVVHGIEEAWSAHFAAQRDGHETAERSNA